MNLPTRRCSRAVTLLEVLAAMAIVGILAAIAIPAVMAARGAARRTQCASRLRNIGLASASYTAQHRILVPTRGNRSAQVFLLPYLGESVVYDSFNFSIPLSDNATVRRMNLAAYFCPSDTSVPRAEYGRTNYASNLASWPWKGHRVDGTVVPSGEVLDFAAGPVRIADVTDGMTRTALFAEQLVGTGDYSDLPRNIALPNYPLSGVDPTDRDALIAHCQSLPPRQGDPDRRGIDWASGNISMSQYTHSGRPGSRGCFGSPPLAGPMPPASMHGDGFQLVYADGHTVYLNYSIDLSVWSAMGSRDGGEVADLPD